jgi:hypothetical protein
MPLPKKFDAVVFAVTNPEYGITQYSFSYATPEQMNTLADLPTARDRLKFAQENMTPADFRLQDDPKDYIRPATIHVSAYNPWGHSITAAGERKKDDNPALQEKLVPAAINGYVQLALACRPS